MENDKAKAAFIKVLEGLLEKARRDEVNWTYERGEKGKPLKGSYTVKLPASSIRIDFISPESDPDFYVARLLNGEGRSVKVVTAQEIPAEQAQWDLLKSLWDEAYRAISGWDKALADAQQAVASDDTIGDIPF